MTKLKPGKSKEKESKIRVSDLKIHPKAQRSVVKRLVRDIEKNLDLNAIGTLTAVDYKIRGKSGPWVIDGQHRLVALRNLDLGHVFVRVFIDTEVTDDVRASELFLKLNKRVPMKAYDEYINQFRANDPVVRSVDRIVREHNLVVVRSGGKGHNSDNEICCVSTLVKLYIGDSSAIYGHQLPALLHERGRRILSITLDICIGAWGAKSWALEGSLIAGIGLVVSKHDGKIDYDIMIKKLSKYSGGPSTMIGDARGFSRHNKASVVRCVAQLVVDTYNKGRGKKNWLEHV